MKGTHISFDESLADEWAEDLGIVEVPLANRILLVFNFVILGIGILVISRFLTLGIAQGGFYERQAQLNLAERQELPAPRGLIFDRYGKTLAENKESFSVFLNVREFLGRPDLENQTVETVREIVGIQSDEFWKLLNDTDIEKTSGRILLAAGLDLSQIIELKDLNLPTLLFENGFQRVYSDGEVFSSLIGYTGLVSPADLERDSGLNFQAVIGKTGLEKFYDQELSGQAGRLIQFRNARGELLGEPETQAPKIGKSLNLTIDGDFQHYFARRFRDGLTALGRTTGVGLAMNPQNGEVLALFNFPTFDNNTFSTPKKNEEREKLLTSPSKLLFNRAVAGLYTPGSTIKPLVGVAALKEDVVTPEKQIFSPGYLDIPNPFRAGEFTRYLDWRPQGWVSLTSAIAQSSNVYFYTVGGGFENTVGLGISRLHQWWQKFNLGNLTGIDLPFEANGFLPTPNGKTKLTGEPWRLGDTYNVSIGQGELQVTPIQLLSYISATAADGKMYRPFIASNFNQPALITDLSYLLPELREVQKGMIAATESPLGTAYLLHDLSSSVAAKTGTAQVLNGAQENAFFVGYAPADDPQIAILVLIENSKEGSLNTVPIAKDVLNWYYENRIKSNR